MPTTQETHALCVQVMGDGWQLWIAFQQLRYHVSGRFPVPFCLFMPPFFSFRGGVVVVALITPDKIYRSVSHPSPRPPVRPARGKMWGEDGLTPKKMEIWGGSAGGKGVR